MRNIPKHPFDPPGIYFPHIFGKKKTDYYQISPRPENCQLTFQLHICAQNRHPLFWGWETKHTEHLRMFVVVTFALHPLKSSWDELCFHVTSSILLTGSVERLWKSYLKTSASSV